MGEQQKQQDSESSTGNRWRLSSGAASDLKWWHRCAGAELGFRASSCEPQVETVRVPSKPEKPLTKQCRRCAMSMATAEPMCPFCRSTRFSYPKPRPEGVMAVKSTHAGASRSSTEKPQHVIVAAAKHRRIGAGIERMSLGAYHVTERAYAGRQHGADVRRVFGDFGEIAIGMPRFVDAYLAYAAKHEPAVPREEWLIAICRDRPEGDPFLVELAHAVAGVVGDAIAAYAAVRTAPSREERDGEERPAKAAKRVKAVTGGPVRRWNEVPR